MSKYLKFINFLLKTNHSKKVCVAAICLHIFYAYASIKCRMAAHTCIQLQIWFLNYCSKAFLRLFHLFVFFNFYSLLYIHHRLSDYAQLYSQEYIIELTDIDSTGPNNVRTNPFRSHHSDINAVPRGVNFIQAFVSNALKFMPIINGV